MPRITWYESYTTTGKYSAEITEEEAKLFEEDPDRFFEEVDYLANKDLLSDDISNEEESDFEIEYDEE